MQAFCNTRSDFDMEKTVYDTSVESAYVEQLDTNKVSRFDSCYSKSKFYFLIKIETAS